MPELDIYEIAQQHRAALLTGEQQAAARMIRAWGVACARIERDLTRLVNEIERMRERGDDVGIARLLRMERYRALLAQIDAETARFTESGQQSVLDSLASAYTQATDDATEQIATIRGEFDRIPVRAVESAAGLLAEASPVTALFRSLRQEGVQRAQDALIAGLAAGHNPRKTAPLLRDALGVPLTRALTISRTETLRAYREGSLSAYRESRVVEMWRWLGTKSARTCPACLAMDGTLHPLSESFGSHPNCRCTPTPWFSGMPARESGAEWFERQSPETWAQILGREAAALYEKSAIGLSDFVGEKSNARWGLTRYTRSIKEIRNSTRRLLL